MALPRFMIDNLLQTPGAVIVPSSELASMPRAALLGTGVRRLRFAPGWTVVDGVNSRILFTRGSQFNANIAAGHYATPALYAEAVRVAMEAADATPVWACDYGVGAADSFRISTAAHAFTLDFGTANAPSAHPDLGYATTTTGSAMAHTAGSVAYQSRHWVNIDLGSVFGSEPPATTALVRGHNIGAGGTVRLDVNSASMLGLGLLGGADFTVDLTGTAVRSAVFASQTEDFHRLIIEDVQNSAGFNELASWFLGTPDELTILPSVQYSVDKEPLSQILYAEGGAHHQVPRNRRRVYRLLFQLEERNGLAVADRAIFDAIDALGIGANFFATFDAPSEAGLTVYGFNRVGLNEVYVQGTLWAIVMELAEALG